MRQRVPEILIKIAPIKTHLAHEKWKAERYATGKKAKKKIDDATEKLKKMDEIEQWIRSRITEEEWKALLG